MLETILFLFFFQMLEPVMKMHNLKLLLRSNKQQEARSGATSDSDTVECSPKKLRRSSHASSASVSVHESPIRDEPIGEVASLHSVSMLL